MKTNVYVDAFNLYYGSLKGTQYKWLDIKKLCEQAFPNDTIGKIRVFAANVKARPSNPQQPIRQQIYFRALRTIPDLEIHLGQFNETEIWAPLVNPFPSGSVNFWPEALLLSDNALS
jgi:hypothetical protein